jgi:hypothetical protein
MQVALFAENWTDVAMTSMQIAQKLMSIQIPVHHRLGTPWVWAWEALKKSSSNSKPG